MDGDGEGVCGVPGVIVAGLDEGVRVEMKMVRKIRQIVLQMLIRWRLWVYWVVKERITMTRQKSEIGLETTNVMRGDSRWRYIVGHPESGEAYDQHVPPLYPQERRT